MSLLKLVKNNSPVESTSINTKYPSAITEAINKLVELADLDDNWDSYSALSPTKPALLGAYGLAYDLFEEGMPPPDVFPVPNGNIQFEWSCFNIDLEIEVASDRKYHAHFEDLQTGDTWEKEFTFDLTELRSKISELTSRSKHANKLKVVNG